MSHETIQGYSTLTVHNYRYLKPIFKWRGYFYVPPLLVMAMCFWNEYENDLIIWSIGPLLMAISLVIRIWATSHIGKRIPRKYRNGRVIHLVKTGPYSFVRNPLYIGNIAAMMGLCLLSELLWFIPIVFAYFSLLYSLVVRFEEYKLSILFGKEYEVYCQEVPRWIPRFCTIRRAKGGNFSWSRAARGELPGVASTSVMILIFLGKEIMV